MSDKNSQLEAIAKKVTACKKCELCKQATNAVPGAGNANADIMFIGEAPGFHEDQQGIPFVGRAGKLLEFMLSQIGMTRDDVYIGNIIKHRPPQNRDPKTDEINACKPYLTKQIEIIQPKVIATLGRFSMNYFLPEAKISHAHGEPVTLANYILYPLYHPAAGLRNPKLKQTLIEDFLKLSDILEIDSKKIDESASSDKSNLDESNNNPPNQEETHTNTQIVFDL